MQLQVDLAAGGGQIPAAEGVLERREKMGFMPPVNIWYRWSGKRGEFDRRSYNGLLYGGLAAGVFLRGGMTALTAQRAASIYMRPTTYDVEAVVEETHWWFVGRRRLFRRELTRAGASPEGRTLDVGTSTGSNLRLLRDLGYTRVTGLDVSLDAIRFCESKGLGPVQREASARSRSTTTASTSSSPPT